MNLFGLIVQVVGGLIVVALMLIFWLPFVVLVLLFVLGIFVLVALIFFIAQLTGKPIEIKEDDVVIGYVQYFKYIPIKKKGLLYPPEKK